jgi:hypothetical protein
MPVGRQKGISVAKTQWELVKQLVEQHPELAGDTLAEFYRIAARERIEKLLSLINLLKEVTRTETP